MSPSRGGRLSVVMAAGDLRHWVKILEVVEAADTFGGAGVPTSFREVDTVPAAIEEGGAQELVTANQLAAQKTITVRMRYWPGLTAKHWLSFQDPARGERLLDVQGVIDIDNRRRHMHVVCIERSTS